MKLKITAVEFSTGEKTVIDDLYWFEENGVHWFDCPEFYFEFDISPSETLSSKPLRIEIQSTPGTSRQTSDEVALEIPNAEIINESDIEPDRIEWKLPFKRIAGQ